MNRKVDEEPGGSLFKGEGSIFVGEDDRQQEEEEELEDQKRRDQELQNLVANYFGNTSFDDEQSLVSTSFDSTNTSRFKDEETNVPEDETGIEEKYMESAYKETSLYGNEQWQVLYQNALREEKKLKELLQELKVSSKAEIDAVNRKYYLAEAESRRFKLLLDQAQTLINEKTEVLRNQEMQLNEFNSRIVELETLIENLKSEVTLWKSNSTDLEQKLHLMEKGLNTAVSEKQIRSHYEQEISKLQLTLQTVNEKLIKSEEQCKVLQEHVTELEYIRDSLISQRDDYLKDMIQEREDNAKKCKKIMDELREIKREILEVRDASRDSSVHSNQQGYQEFLDDFKSELKRVRDELKFDVAKLQEKCEQYRRNEERLKIELKKLKDTNIVPGKNYEQIIATLESELKRSITEQGLKRNEIDKLENLVKELRKNEDALNEELKTLKEKEHMFSDKQFEEFLTKYQNNLELAIIDLDARREEIKRQEENIKKLQIKEDELNQRILKKMEEYEKLEESKAEQKESEINKLKEKIKCLEENQEHLKKNKRNSLVKEQLINKDNEIQKLNKTIEELQIINKELKDELNAKKSSPKPKESLNKAIIEENSQLKEKLQQLMEDNKKLGEELKDRSEKEKENSLALNQVVQSFSDLEKGVQARAKITEEKLIEAQNTILILQSQLSEKHNTEIALREELAKREDNEEIVQDLLKKSAMFQDYMKSKGSIFSPNKVQKAKKDFKQSQNEVKDQTNTTISSINSQVERTDNSCDRIAENESPTETEVLATIMEKRNAQLIVLLEENKNLKEKLKMDRDALNELTQVWNDEMKNLNTALASALQSRQELLNRTTNLSSDIQTLTRINADLKKQITCLNEVLKKFEVAATAREQAFIMENMKLKKSINTIFETVLLRVTRCISKTNSKTNIMDKI